MNTTNTTEETNGCKTEAAEPVYAKPRYHAQKTESGYDLRVYVPGADKSGVTIALENEVLTVTAKRREASAGDWRTVSRELPASDYRLPLRLHAKIDPERITAKLDNGVLDVVLPLQANAGPRVIEVS